MKYIKNEYINLMIKMSFPILMNYLVMSVFEVLDKAIVGNYAIDDFAAVGLSATIIFALTGTLGSLSIAYNIMAAKCLSENNKEKFYQTFHNVMTLSLLIGIGIIILSFVGGEALFQNFYGLKGNVLKLCHQYFSIASFTILLNMVTFNFSVYFRNLKNTKITLYSTIVATTINILFDYILVYGKFGFVEYGASGAALGSVIGLFAGCLVYALQYIRSNKFSFKLSLDKRTTKKLLTLYVPLLGQDLMEGTIFVFILGYMVSKLGTYEMASYNLADSVGGIMSLPIYAFSTTAITLALQEASSCKQNSSNEILKTAIILSGCCVLFIGGVITVFPSVIFGLITNDQTVILSVTRLFGLVVIVQLFNICNQLYKCYLQGIGHEKYVFTVSCVISLVSISWFILLIRTYDLAGIYMGLIFTYAIYTVVYRVKLINKRN